MWIAEWITGHPIFCGGVVAGIFFIWLWGYVDMRFQEKQRMKRMYEESRKHFRFDKSNSVLYEDEDGGVGSE